jgi:triacylglycerol lipase
LPGRNDQQTPGALDVRYFWTAGVGRSGPPAKASKLLLSSYEYLKLVKDEDNDGAVPLSSASHGEQIGELWEADHLDEVGHDLNHLPNGTPPNFNYLDKYDEIVRKVSLLRKFVV